MHAKIWTLTLVFALGGWSNAHADPATDGVLLREQVTRHYPSLRYVERYRQAYPDEVPGTAFWMPGAAAPDVPDAAALTRTLAALADQHVALVGPRAGKTETLGVLFRSASDGSLIVWRVFDPALDAAHLVGDRVLAIDGQDTRGWMEHAAAVTFGGQRRGRYAEAATELGLGTPVEHRVAGLGGDVALRLQDTQGSARKITLHYKPVDAALAKAMTAAINRPDLPARFTVADLRVGTLRLGAFAPQFDAAFNAAADAASQQKGATEDTAMLAGYCAVVHHFVATADAVARDADVLVLDLRGNLGGFDRETRLLADALAAKPSPATFDLFIGSKPGTVRLTEEARDPDCAHIRSHVPLVVLTDAGTRSAGEFMASWLWASGALVGGERTVGAGGGFEFDGKPSPPLPASGYGVRLSGNFSVFDPTATLAAGEHAEDPVIATLAADGFAPSRKRPFAIQSAGLRPDLALTTTGADLRDGGLASLAHALVQLRARHMFDRPLDPAAAGSPARGRSPTSH